jgi:hypothetical protein
LVGVAVNVTFVPEQIVLPGSAAILTEGVTELFTVTVKEQLTVGEAVNEYVTVVAPELKVNPLAEPLPLPVVAPANV